MKTEEWNRKGYTMVYNVSEAGVDFEPTDDLVKVSVLARYNLNAGYRVFQVGASYAQSIKPSFYYVISTSKSSAKEKFRRIFSWLDVISCIEPLLPDAAEEVLSCPAKYIVL